MLSLANIEFKPIDLEKDRDMVIKFREDSFVCSFGSNEKFWAENGPNAELYIEWLTAKIKNAPFSAVHIWLGDRIVGQMELGTFKRDPSVGYINLYYLIPEFRGTGLSKLLDDYAVQYLRGKGFLKARLSVSPTNLRAVRYYSRMGWVDIGTRPDAPEVSFMEKAI